jgi:hypothetical protein
MTAEIVARAILVAGAFALVIGPGMQARLEMREYHDLLEALSESDLPDVTRNYLRALATGPSMALRSPIGAIEFAIGARAWWARYRPARLAFAQSPSKDDERVVNIRSHLTRARNWAIVVFGSVLIFVGAAIELVQTING